MPSLDDHVWYLFAAELQFRLASVVRIAVTMKRQPLDAPLEWTFGKQRVSYEEVALREDQADVAASLFQRSSTYTMAVAVKDSIEAIVPGLSQAVRKAKPNLDQAIMETIQGVNSKPWKIPDEHVVNAYCIARLIRNAYAHAPFAPMWKINPEFRDRVFKVPGVIELKTNGLDRTAFDWRHYGGPLAVLKMCRFVRMEILGNQSGPRKVLPIARRKIQPIGDLILEAEAIPPGAERVKLKKNADGSIDLGGGYSIGP